MSDINNYLQKQSPQFEAGRLFKDQLSANPFEQFKIWFNDAIIAGATEANAMTLATVDNNRQPSNRVVLLKEVEENGFVFFTNYNSRKAKEISQNPSAAINFYWTESARQVRIEGTLKKVSEKESDEYFKSRPRMSQLGALASNQSQVIDSNVNLDQRVAALEQEYLNRDITRPEYWGGYMLIPHRIEFWQGRPSRLHDRFQYSLQKDGAWQIDRLSP